MKENFKNLNSNSGFTLVELIVVIAIMIVLLSMLVPHLLGYIEKANNVADIANAKSMCNALQISMAVSNDGTIDFGENPWGEDQRTKGYIYVDDDEIRTSSREVARALEEGGVLMPGAADTAQIRGDREPYFKIDKTKFFCKSSKRWDRYQINFVGKSRGVMFTYTASRDGREQDPEATEDFASMIGGVPSGDNITLGPKQ